MEIYTFSSNILSLDSTDNSSSVVSFDAAPSAAIYDDDSNQLLSTITASAAGEIWMITLPYQYTTMERNLRVEWSYSVNSSPITQKQYINVVTPYLSFNDMRNIQDDLAIQDMIDLEKHVRAIINTYCGQTFGMKVKTYNLSVSPGGSIQLPERAVSISSVIDTSNSSVQLYPSGYTLDSSQGFLLTNYNYSGYWEDMWASGPISGPLFYNQPLYATPYTVTFQITGVFGWESVPSDVSLAAKLLAKQFLCPDDIYRTKQVVSLGSNTWTLEFSPNASETTGNIDVDKILSQYKLLNIEVI